MKKLISSSLYKNDFAKVTELAKKNGCGIEISRFDICSDEYERMEAVKYMQKHLTGFENEITLHGFFFDLNIASHDAQIKNLSLLRHNQSFEIARDLGISTVVFHTGFNPYIKHSDYLLQTKNGIIEFWARFTEKFEKHGMVAVLENVLEQTPEFITEIITKVGSDSLKVSLDVGHANIHSTMSVENWINFYGKNLYHMHLHNNSKNDDSHFSILNGTLNFETIYKTLIECELSPKLVFEIFTEKDLLESLDYIDKLEKSFGKGAYDKVIG